MCKKKIAEKEKGARNNKVRKSKAQEKFRLERVMCRKK
jgi:hypothetical protein